MTSKLDSNSLLNNKLIHDYNSIITDFLNKMTNISFIPNDTEYDCMLYVGINIIHRVYEYVLFKLENVKSSHYYSEKAYVYFIEYMEQMYVNGLSQNINHNEAILFIYKKTIFELHNENMDTMTNIITLNNDIFNDNYIKYIKNISHLRWTVDKIEDLELVRKIVSKIKNRPILMNNILELLENEPNLIKINSDV